MNCSFSPQISDSNDEPAAEKWQTTAQSRPANLSDWPMAVLPNRDTRRRPTQISPRPDSGRRPATSSRLDRTVQACSLTPRTTTFATCVWSNTFGREISTYTSGLTRGRPSPPAARCGELAMMLAASRVRPLESSESAPRRRTSAF